MAHVTYPARTYALRHRRGSIYAMVLGMTMLITVIGIGALATSRITGRAAGMASDWEDAGAIAFSAIEHAITKLNTEAAASPTTWRNAYTSGATAFTSSFGRGTLKWVLLDEEDGSISDDPADAIKIYGIGQIGSVKRVYSLQISATGDALDVLRTGIHSHGAMTILDSTIAIGGPVSTNGSLSISGSLRGSSETSPAKTMPSASVFEMYRARATVIPSAAASSGTFALNALSATDNPYGDENPEGIYLLKLPADITTLSIISGRMKGTLLLENATGRSDQMLLLEGAMLLEPHRSDLPTLIVKGIREVTIKGSMSPYTELLTTYPSEIRGLVHFINTQSVKLKNEFYIKGTVICDGPVQLSDPCAFVTDSTLLTNPPVGYTKGNKVIPVPSSWKWDSPPAGH